MSKVSIFDMVFCFILFIAFTFASAELQSLPVKKIQKISKENQTMTISFSQRYANIHRNSLVLEKSEVSGKNVQRLQITGRDGFPESTDFLLYDSERGVLCTSWRVYIISLKNGTTGKYYLKGINAPVVCLGMRIFFDNWMLSCIKPEDDEDTVPAYSIPGSPGGYSHLRYLFPFNDYFVSGVILCPFPKNVLRHQLLLGCSLYKEGENELWSIIFDKPIPPPPVCNLDGNIIIFHKGVLRLINAKDGSTILEKPTEREILSCSVGPNGRLYTVASYEISHYLIEWDEKFNEIGSVEILRLPWTQPPVTLVNGTVLLVASGLVIAFREQQQLWQYACLMSDTKQPFLVTATSNNRILLIAGTRLICLDENGKELWVYQKEDAEPFRTQPVVGHDGEVYVVDNRALYVVR